MKKIYALALILIALLTVKAQAQPNAFITQWKTSDGSITIPTTGAGYSYNVTWMDVDGTAAGSASAITGDYTINGLVNGHTIQVSITGSFPRIYFNGRSGSSELIEISRWGPIAWTSMRNAFSGCVNLDIKAIDQPNLSAVTDLSGMFAGCSNLRGETAFWNWNTENVINMSRMFMGAESFNKNINSWNTENVTQMNVMFANAKAFNQPIGVWNVSNVGNMFGMFMNASTFNQNIGSWDVSKVTNMGLMFGNASAFNQDITNWNVSRVADMANMFEKAAAFDQNLGSWTISSVTTMMEMLAGAGLSPTNYDATLIGWSQQTNLKRGVELGATNLSYCRGRNSRQILIDRDGWNITGDQEAAYCPRPDDNGVLYVDSSAGAGGKGSSWAEALQSLEEALAVANTINSHAEYREVSVKQIWVAKGTYQPASGKSFAMLPGISIYGGFAGTETNLSERASFGTPPESGASILKGNGASVVHIKNPDIDQTVSLDGFIITGGQTSVGGGIFVDEASPILSNLIIKENTSLNVGGGLYLKESSAILIQVIISNNTALRGGGLSMDESFPVLINSVISNNEASQCGGGIHSLKIGIIKLTNSILWGNVAPMGADIWTELPSDVVLSHCLHDSTIDESGEANITLVNSIEANPQFFSPNDFRLKYSSPAINAGTNVPFGAGELAEPVTNDFYGNARIYDMAHGGMVDIGVYEYQRPVSQPDANGVLYVDSAAAPGGDGSSWSKALRSFDDALAVSHEINVDTRPSASSVKQIWVARGTYPTPASRPFEVQSNLKIYGGFLGNETTLAERPPFKASPGTAASILKGNGNNVLLIHSSTIDRSAILDGFVITGGDAGFRHGGGISVISASPTLKNLVIKDNNTINWAGGLYIESGSPVVLNAIISRNKAGNGGGLYFKDASPTLVNTVIRNNTARNYAGAFVNFGTGSATLINSILWSNTAGQGDDIWKEPSSTVTLLHCIYPIEDSGDVDAQNSMTSNPYFAGQDDYRLKSYSPAINAGTNDPFTSGEVAHEVMYDLDGKPRIFDEANGGIIDIGVYEYQQVRVMPELDGILYVDSAAASGGDGSSWSNALNSFADALAISAIINANANGNPANSVRQIWVAKGTYQPAAGESFSLLPRVKIYGSFAGTESSLSERRLSEDSRGSYVSILKGNGETVIHNNGTNHYDQKVERDAVLDGFIITGGDATTFGGGINLVYSAPTLSNLTITGNNSRHFGGGIYCLDAFPLLINVIISENSSEIGAGLYLGRSTSDFVNSVISGNTALSDGGGLTLSRFSTANLTNSIVWGNKARIINEIGLDLTSRVNLHHSIYSNGINDLDEFRDEFNVTNSITADPQFQGPGNYRLKPLSPAINTGTNEPFDSGEIAAGVQIDRDGNPRIYDQAHGGIADIGAYEFQASMAHPDENGILYVDSAAAPGGNGSTWDRALQSLDTALTITESLNGTAAPAGPVKQIWVAKGTYLPPKGKFFRIDTDLEIYGGFSGTETNISQRNILLGSKSILKGNGASVIGNYNDTGLVILDGFKVTGAKGVHSYGGIRNGGGRMVVRNCLVSDNHVSSAGGGIGNLDGDLTLINTVIINNSAEYGGGIAKMSGNITIINCVVANNSALYDGGIAMFYLGNTITNSIFWGNRASYGGSQVGELSPPIDVSYSIIQDGYPGTGNLDMNPLFVDTLAGNFQLRVSSPAINAGNNNPFETGGPAEGLVYDKNGNPRIHDRAKGGIVDIGAYEYQGDEPHPDPNGIIYVNKAAVPGGDGGSWPNALQSLEDALVIAASINSGNGGSTTNPVKEIWIAEGIYQPTPGKPFEILPNVKVYGSFAGNEANLEDRPPFNSLDETTITILKGNGSSVVSIVAPGGQANNGHRDITLDGFLITGGNAPNGNGGGIVNHRYDVTFKNLVIKNNSAKFGGGLFIDDADPLLINVIISDNSAEKGGGVYNGGTDATLVNTVISNNTATTGGGIYIDYSSAYSLTNSIIWGNHADDDDDIRTMPGFKITASHSIYSDEADDISSLNDFQAINSITSDPQFIGPGNYRLKQSSPGVNAGTNSPFAPGEIAEGIAFDLAGNTRIFDLENGGIVDIGAFEIQAHCPEILISRQAAESAICIGGGTTFAIEVTGDNLTYQWQHSSDGGTTFNNLQNDASFSGVQTAILSITNATPDADGIYRCTISNGCKTISSDGAALKVTNMTLSGIPPEGQVGKSYSFNFATSGGTGAITWSLAQGDLPGQIQLNAQTGELRGIPHNAGEFPVTIQAEDASGCSSTLPAILTITPGEAAVITFSGLSPVSYGNPEFDPGASSSDGRDVNYISNDETVARITPGGLIRIMGAGTAQITASLPPDPNYEDALPVVHELMVNPAHLTITANSDTKTYDGIPYSGGNGVTISGWKYSDTDDLINKDLTYSGPSQGAVNAGTYEIRLAGPASLKNYTISYQPGTLAIQPARATINFRALAPVSYGNPEFDPGASSSDGRDVNYTSTDETVARITPGGLIRIMGAGTAQITASLPPDPNYEDALPVVHELVVNPAHLTITANSDTKTYDGIPYSGGNGVTISGWKYSDTDDLINKDLTYSGPSQGAVNAGTYEIRLAGPASLKNYTISYQPGTLAIQPARATINFPALAPVSYGNPEFDPGASSSDGRDVHYTSTDETVARITPGGLIQIMGAGTAQITASLPPDPNYEDAQPVTQDLVVNPALLTITAQNKTRKYGQADPAFTFTFKGFVNGEDESDLDQMPTAMTMATAASIPGTYPIIPSGAASKNYELQYVAGTMTVLPATRKLAFDPLPEKTYGDPDFGPGAVVTGSEEAVIYTSSNPAVAEIVNGKIHINGAGTADITASLPDNPYFEPEPAIRRKLTVRKAPQTITFVQPGEVARDAATLSLQVSSSSGLPLSLTSSDTQVATIAGETQLNILRLGTTLITATQSGDGNYLPAEPVSQELKVVDALGTLVKVHQAISPNGDGINEFLLVEGIRDYPENKMTIINRNGVKVFEVNGYDNGSRVFKGLANTNVSYEFLPQGTYFYLLEIKTGGTWKRETGWFVLRFSMN